MDCNGGVNRDADDRKMGRAFLAQVASGGPFALTAEAETVHGFETRARCYEPMQLGLAPLARS